MFDFFKKKKKAEEPFEYRDLLFGDCPMAQWPADSPPDDEEPWLSFVEAREHLEAGRQREATNQLRHILSLDGLESRQYLQAWHFLRQAGVKPTEATAKQVLGVVVEAGLLDGTDTVAAYADGSARYENHSGAVIAWDAPDGTLGEEIENLLAAGKEVTERIGPWLHPRPPAPRKGQARINMLTPSGLHFGEADFETLVADPLGGPVVLAALALMKRLMAEVESGRIPALEEE